MNSMLSARLPHGDPVDWRGVPSSVLQNMTDQDYRPNLRAQEAAREAALLRASQMAADLGTAARTGARDARARAAEPMPPPARRPRRRYRFLRFLVTIALGVAGTIAWQTYGGEARRMIAARMPELTARAPALASLIAQLPPGILTPSAEGEAASTTAASRVSAASASAAATSAAPPPSPEVMRGLETVARELVAMRYGMDRLTTVQTQMNGIIAKMQAEEEARHAPASPSKPAAKPAPRPAAAAPSPLPLTSQSTSSTTLPPRRPTTVGQ